MKTIYIFIILSIIFKQLNMYKYRVKGKDMTFDTSQLNDKDKLRWEKLGKIGKLRMIESYNLNDKSGVPGDYIDVKTVKDKPQNERLARLRIEEQKKTELDKIKQNNELKSSDSIDDAEDVMSDEQKTLFKDDLSKLKKDNQNPTISDLEKVYATKIEQLTANEIGTINAKNVDTINANSVNKLLFDVRKLTDELVNPLRPVLENLIERHGDDREVLEYADKNDIEELMNELKKLKDDTSVNEIKAQMDTLKNQIDNLLGVKTDMATIYKMMNENKAKLNEMLDKIKNEPNPIKRVDEMKEIIKPSDDTSKQFNELKEMIEKMMNEQLTKEQVMEIINDESLFEDLKNELKTEYGDQITPLINSIDDLTAKIDERTIVDDEMNNYNEVVSAVRNIIYNNPQLGDSVSKEDVEEMLKDNKAELTKQIDSTIKSYTDKVLEEVKNKVDANTKQTIMNLVSDTLQQQIYNDEATFNNALDDELVKQMKSMYYKLVSEGAVNTSTQWEIPVQGEKDLLTVSSGDYVKYDKEPTRNFDEDFVNLILPALLRGERPRKKGSKSQTGKELSQYGFSQFMNFASNILNQHRYLDRKSGSILSKIKGKLTSDDVKKNINNLNSETQSMKNDFKELKGEIKELKDEIKGLTNELKELKNKPKIPHPPKMPESKHETKHESIPSNSFLDDIINSRHKDLKHVEVNDKSTPKDSDDGIVSNLKDIMKRRREDIEPDEYSEDEDVDWAAGINKRISHNIPKMLTYAQFKELFG